jgi:hypothetical protein
MENSILVIDDDALMRPSLAVSREQAGHWRSRAAGTEDVLALTRVYPREMIFLTARRARLDQVLGPEVGADNHVARLFDLDGLSARIKAIFATSVASVATQWKHVWAPAMFAVGALLLVLAAPPWAGWLQALATYGLPAEDMAVGWLTHLLFDPAATFNSLLSGAARTWLDSVGQTDMLVTLAIIALSVATVGGLGQLLGDAH